jgi:DNA replication and repair protein RecF
VLLDRLALADFRNFSHLVFRPSGGWDLLLGANGAGKTSILEALYLVATTRSFRTAELGDCVRRGSGGLSIAASCAGPPRRDLQLALGEGRKRRSVDGKTTTLAEHVEVLPILAWTHAEHELVLGAPALRRRFLDRALVHARRGALADLARYERALAGKRALLAGLAGGPLAPWNELLAEHGARLATARLELVRRLAVELEQVRAGLAIALPPLAARYRPSLAESLAGPRALLERLSAAEGEERRRGRPLYGAHRDDLELDWNGSPARATASVGERKAFGRLLLAALARVARSAAGRAPLVVLDDVDAELDRDRLEGLLGAFAGLPQGFLTSSRRELWRPRPGLAAWSVADSRIEAVNL